MADDLQRRRTLRNDQRREQQQPGSQNRPETDEGDTAADEAAAPDEPDESTGRRWLQRARQLTRQATRDQRVGASVASVDAVNRYRNVQRAVDAVKLITGGLGSIGEIFFSAWVFIFVAHGEWLYSSLINPQYKLAGWKKALVIMADLIIFTVVFAVLTVVGTVGYIFIHPLETIKFTFGATWEGLKSLIGGFVPGQ